MSFLPVRMLHEHDERVFVENNNECPPFAPSNDNFDPDPDPMLSMQLHLAGRLSEYFPHINYSEQRDSVNVQRSVQQNEYHSNDSLSLLIQQGRSNRTENDDNQILKLQKLEMNNATAEVDLSYIQRDMEGNYQLGVSHPDHPDAAHYLNLEPNFIQGSKVCQSDVDSRQQNPQITYPLPTFEGHPSTINNTSASSSTPLQAYRVHIYDYPDLALQLQQHDCQINHTVDNLTDFIRLQGPTPVPKRCPSQDLEEHRKESSLFISSLDSVERQGSQVHLQGSDSILQRNGDVSAAVWEAASKYHEDTKQRQNEQQEAYDEQEAFLNFLRFSNAPHVVSKYYGAAPGNVLGNLQIRGKFSEFENEHEPLDLLDAHRRGSVSTSVGLHTEAVAGNGISCSLPASQARSGTLTFQDDTDNVPKYIYRDTLGSELPDLYTNSVPNSSVSCEKNVKVTSSPYLNVQPAHNTGEAFTPSLKGHSGLDLECNYHNTAQHSISLQQEFEAVETRMKQVFKTEKQRRDFIKERYKTLQSLVPRYSKTDRASIVGDTIQYIHVLQQRIKELTLKKEETRERRKTESSRMTGEASGECSKLRPKLSERKLAEFCNSDERELRLTSKHGAVVKFQLNTDELHVSLVQKREPFFLNRLLASLSGFDLVNTSGGIIRNYYVMVLIFKIKGKLRETSVDMMAKIMETLDQII